MFTRRKSLPSVKPSGAAGVDQKTIKSPGKTPFLTRIHNRFKNLSCKYLPIKERAWCKNNTSTKSKTSKSSSSAKRVKLELEELIREAKDTHPLKNVPDGALLKAASAKKSASAKKLASAKKSASASSASSSSASAKTPAKSPAKSSSSAKRVKLELDELLREANDTHPLKNVTAPKTKSAGTRRR